MHRKETGFRYGLAVLVLGIAVLSGTNVFATSGNVDGLGEVDLRDVIISLQVCTGNPVSGVTLDLNADVNGDRRIGVPEAVYGLQMVAGMICIYSISPEYKIFTVSGGTDSVNVTAQNECEWKAVSNAPSWLTVTSGSSSRGNGTVSYSFTANTGKSYRSGTLTVAGKTFTVAQAGELFPDVYFELAIRMAINKSEGDLLKEDLESLTRLEASHMNIQNIEGIQYCTNLKYLYLSGNQITDIKPLIDNTGIDSGDIVMLSGSSSCPFSPCVIESNPLSIASCKVYVPQLLNRGVNLTYKCDSNPIVSIPDSNLEVVIREAISRPEGNIYFSDLQG